MTSNAPRYAVFVSPHGYGHAARASGVMEALNRHNGARFEVFTTAPRWFFEESLKGLFEYHEVECDVGFRQASALKADLGATAVALDELLPFPDDEIDRLPQLVRASGCEALLADIAPFGVAVAERAGIPSVLVENFTWSWLYEPFFGEHPELEGFSDELAMWRSRATVLIQTEPLCSRDEGARLVNPISRTPRLSRSDQLAALGVGEGERLIVVTMGGYGEPMPFLDELRSQDGVTFVVTGAQETSTDGNLRLFSNQTPIFMPDMMRAADAVVAKLGYGTVAEVWAEGLPYAYVSRPGFPEMPPLEAFSKRELGALEMSPSDFSSGKWIGRIPELLSMPRTPRTNGGAESVAEVLAGL